MERLKSLRESIFGSVLGAWAGAICSSRSVARKRRKAMIFIVGMGFPRPDTLRAWNCVVRPDWSEILHSGLVIVTFFGRFRVYFGVRRGAGRRSLASFWSIV